MKFDLIDYSEYYYTKSGHLQIPVCRGGKFVQIRNVITDTEYIVLAPKALAEFHADIVKLFCTFNKISGRESGKKKLFMISDSNWSVVGGGKWVMNSKKRIIELGDLSMAYGPFDHVGLEDKLLSLEQMKDYTIEIES